MSDKRFLSNDSENVDENVSPIYVPLEPDWADTKTMEEPLMSRGWFSNAWVMYDESDFPRQQQAKKRPNALSLENQRTASETAEQGYAPENKKE